MICRFCGGICNQQVIDLGVAPPSNAYLNPEDLNKPALFFPLNVFVCDRCWLVQTEDYTRAGELFRDDYAYFSSTSATWVEHAARYAEMICRRLEIDHESLVVEIASNDGYLLKNFLSRGIPCLGVEPSDGTAAAAAPRATTRAADRTARAPSRHTRSSTERTGRTAASAAR